MRIWISLLVAALLMCVARTSVAQGNKSVYNYDGTTEDGKKSGYGTCTWPNGDKYVGEFLNDTMHGIGTMYYADSNRYEGHWKNGVQNGKGSFFWKSGDKYEGYFANNMMHGRGTCIWINDERYEGDYIMNNRTGEGTYYWPNGDKYVGHFENNMRHGKGTYYYENGARYEGPWVQDKKEGNGVFTWNNGDRYDGHFSNDVKDGYGNYFIQSKKARYMIKYCPRCKKYVGQWKDGLKSGRGSCYNKKGKLIFQGDFANDRPVGRYPSKLEKKK
jgi:hypothetical protein